MTCLIFCNISNNKYKEEQNYNLKVVLDVGKLAPKSQNNAER